MENDFLLRLTAKKPLFFLSKTSKKKKEKLTIMNWKQRKKLAKPFQYDLLSITSVNAIFEFLNFCPSSARSSAYVFTASFIKLTFYFSNIR